LASSCYDAPAPAAGSPMKADARQSSNPSCFKRIAQSQSTCPTHKWQGFRTSECIGAPGRAHHGAGDRQAPEGGGRRPARRAGITKTCSKGGRVMTSGINHQIRLAGRPQLAIHGSPDTGTA
jgi:hypothetical protein